jgi:hypothetical protein
VGGGFVGDVVLYVMLGVGLLCLELVWGVLGGGGRMSDVVAGVGGVGSIGGIRLVSFTVKSSVNCYMRSSTTAVSLSKSILTSVCVSFLHITINSSPLSSILVSVWAVFLYTSILFCLPTGERCTRAVSGERWVFSAFNNERRS